MPKVSPVPSAPWAKGAEHISAADLVGDTEKFLAHHWNRETLLRKNASPTGFRELLDLEVLDTILADRNLREPYVRLAEGGRPVHEKRYLQPLSVQGTALRGVADVNKIAAEFAGGATILLDSIDHYHAPVKNLCDRLHAELRAPAEAVAFMTPPGVQGLTVHHDNTEVFVLQTHGRKQWTVYKQVRPLAGTGKVFRPEELGAPVLEVTLEPGDCLYLPWGSPHFAVSDDTLSCHLSIMLRPPTWETVLNDFIREAIFEYPFAAVPLVQGTDVPALAEALMHQLPAAAQALRDYDHRTFVARHVAAQDPRPAVRAGFLQQATERQRLTYDSRIHRNSGMPFAVSTSRDDSVLLNVDGRTYRMPLATRPALDAVGTFSRGSVRDLDRGLGPRSTLKLVDHLVDNGVLLIG